MRHDLRMMVRFLVLGLLLLVAMAVFAEESIERKYGLDPDFATNLRVEMIGHRLADADELPNINFHIFKSGELNAFAMPDGNIYITSAMARLATDAELAFVIGHEMTHVKEQHSNSLQKQAMGGALLGALLAAALGGKGDSIRMGADLGQGLTYGHYSRGDERRADVGGVRLMAELGYDPKQAASTMQRLLDKYGRGDANTPVIGWFADHPDTKDRKDRVTKLAEELEKKPLPVLPPPQGIELKLDADTDHARGWVSHYLAIAFAVYCQGKAELQMPTPYTSPAEAETAQIAVPPSESAKDKTKAKEEQLPGVSVEIPQVPAAYRIEIAFHQAPAGRAASLDLAKGTGVEATLRWTQLASGFTGTCTAVAQTIKSEPWMANEKLKIPALYRLDDGKDQNLEGTLEAIALRRVAKMFSEVVLANGPVDHSAPVSLRLSESAVRPGDDVLVIRKGVTVAEVCAETVEKRNITGHVLWGTHVWQKDDKFVPAD